MLNLICPECKNVLEGGLDITEEQLHSERYLDGDEPLMCLHCDDWQFPVIVRIETSSANFEEEKIE